MPEFDGPGAPGIGPLMPWLGWLEGGRLRANATVAALAAALGSVEAAPAIGPAAAALDRLHAIMVAMGQTGPAVRTTVSLGRMPAAQADLARALAIVTDARAGNAAGMALPQAKPLAPTVFAENTATPPKVGVSPVSLPPIPAPEAMALPAYVQDALLAGAAEPSTRTPTEPGELGDALVSSTAPGRLPGVTRMVVIAPPGLEQAVPSVFARIPEPTAPHRSTRVPDNVLAPINRVPSPSGVEVALTPFATPGPYVALQPAVAAKPTRPHPAPKVFPGWGAPAPMAEGLATLSAALAGPTKRVPGLVQAATEHDADPLPQWPWPGTAARAVPANALRRAIGMEASYGTANVARTSVPDPLAQLQSYHPPGGQPGAVIQHVTTVQLDERTIARAVTRQQLRMMGGQVSGTLRPDPSIAPQYGAHLLEM